MRFFLHFSVLCSGALFRLSTLLFVCRVWASVAYSKPKDLTDVARGVFFVHAFDRLRAESAPVAASIACAARFVHMYIFPSCTLTVDTVALTMERGATIEG